VTSAAERFGWCSKPAPGRGHRFACRIDVHLIDRPCLSFLGSGETGQGPAAAAAIGNAVANAIGRRLRDLPLTRAKVREALQS
jgi:CO/xanthine dehydrogenase Mo-binding subunit